MGLALLSGEILDLSRGGGGMGGAMVLSNFPLIMATHQKSPIGVNLSKHKQREILKSILKLKNGSGVLPWENVHSLEK